MTHSDPDVKTRPRKIADWLDCHPRTGWWIAAWGLLVTSNALIDWFDRLVGVLT